MKSRGVLWAAVVLVGCGAENQSASSASLEQAVVGGNAEAGYLGAGYLVAGVPFGGPVCGVTAIGPRAVVTAAHCVVDRQSLKLGVGWGAVGSGAPVDVARVWLHPSYNPRGQPRYQHDVAVLALAADVSVPVSPLVSAGTAEQALYVGYGRVTAGGYEVGDGYTAERKSAKEQVTAKDGLNVWAHGDGGGLCWGDSGGPLLRVPGGELLGVLSDFDGSFDCHDGNAMIFTDVAAERAFVEKAVSCGAASDPTCAGSAPPAPSAACEFSCADYGYAPSQCYLGWFCDGQCVRQTGCSG